MANTKILFFIPIFLLLCSPLGSANKDGLTIYCWQGTDTFSHMGNPEFVPKWKAVLNSGSNNIIIDIRPKRTRLLEMMKSADILYGSSHAGIPKKGNQQGLQIGKEDSDDYLLSASEIAAEGITQPSLIIINGCNTFPLLDNPNHNIATAFGIPEDSKERAYIGFKGVHSGPKGDDFFRVFFYFWSGVGGKDLTIKTAAKEAEKYIREMVKKLGGDKAQKYLLSIGAANIYKDLVFHGYEDLRYKDIKH